MNKRKKFKVGDRVRIKSIWGAGIDFIYEYKLLHNVFKIIKECDVDYELNTSSVLGGNLDYYFLENHLVRDNSVLINKFLKKVKE